MHPHFNFSTVEILWTLTFAALLVLLVVLLGRDRARRFPWFTASILLVALRLLCTRVLSGRLPRLTFGAVIITLADLSIVAGALLLVELARRVFRGARRSYWIAGTLIALAVGAVVLRYWGAWPPWKTLTANSQLAALMFMQLIAQKGEFLLDVLAVELGALIVAFGRGPLGGWRSHAQRIAIGLSTAALGQLAIQAIWQIVASHAVPHSKEEYERFLALGDRISNANSALYALVILWWISCLWKDEPGTAPPAAQVPAAAIDAGASPAADENLSVIAPVPDHAGPDHAQQSTPAGADES
jgi:hypothetical protein